MLPSQFSYHSVEEALSKQAIACRYLTFTNCPHKHKKSEEGLVHATSSGYLDLKVKKFQISKIINRQEVNIIKVPSRCAEIMSLLAKNKPD